MWLDESHPPAFSLFGGGIRIFLGTRRYLRACQQTGAPQVCSSRQMHTQSNARTLLNPARFSSSRELLRSSLWESAFVLRCEAMFQQALGHCDIVVLRLHQASVQNKLGF